MNKFIDKVGLQKQNTDQANELADEFETLLTDYDNDDKRAKAAHSH